MNRRDFLKGIGLGAAATAFAEAARAAGAKAERPNIVFILADDLGYGHLGCYGQKKIRTPNVDRLAAEGMKFTQYYAGFTVCAPSRSVLMTGLHHGHTAVRSNSGSSSLLEGETTVAQVLQRAGYTTGGFGKWGLGLQGAPGQPKRKGFDDFYGFYHQVHAHFYYPSWIWHNDEKLPLPGNAGGREQYVDDVLHAKALAFIRAAAKKRRPFFCYVPTIIPHVELAVPEDSVRPYRGTFPRKTINDPRPGYIGSDDAYAVYAGMISRMDRNVGRIVALLGELGIEKNTIVIFTSDNGPQSGPWEPLRAFFRGGGPLRGAKGSLYEGGLRVPFVVRWPGKVRPGTVSDHVGGFQDMMPTFAELAGARPPRTDGISIVPALLGRAGEQKAHEFLFWGGGRTTAVRMGQWKAVRSQKRPWQLYDLSKDVGESNDVAAANAEVVERIEAVAAKAYTAPRKQQHGRRVNIRAYVRGDRVGKNSAR